MDKKSVQKDPFVAKPLLVLVIGAHHQNENGMKEVYEQQAVYLDCRVAP